jgi:hypothetical protein
MGNKMNDMIYYPDAVIKGIIEDYCIDGDVDIFIQRINLRHWEILDLRTVADTMKYYAIRCLSCGRWSGKQVRDEKEIQAATFTCAYCQKSKKIKCENDYGLSVQVKGPVNAGAIAALVAQLNKYQVGDKDGLQTDN